MKEFLKKMVPVTGSDHFPFRCQMCGACCRHVKESVPIDSLDAFRLARFLRNKDKRIRSMDDVLELYAEPVLLHESGYMAFMLKKMCIRDSPHTRPMLSANKTKSIEDLIRFARGHAVVISWKMDGLTLVLRYENGELYQAITLSLIHI